MPSSSSRKDQNGQIAAQMSQDSTPSHSDSEAPHLRHKEGPNVSITFSKQVTQREIDSVSLIQTDRESKNIGTHTSFPSSGASTCTAPSNPVLDLTAELPTHDPESTVQPTRTTELMENSTEYSQAWEQKNNIQTEQMIQLCGEEDNQTIKVECTENEESEEVPVYLLQSVNLLPGQSSIVPVGLGENLADGCFIFERDESVEQKTNIVVNDAVVKPEHAGIAQVLVVNPSGFTQYMERGTRLGSASPAVVETSDVSLDCPKVWRTQSEPLICCPALVDWRKKRLEETLEEPHLPNQEKMMLLDFLTVHHHAFCLEDGERGETDLIFMEINTRDAQPRRQPVRRMPPAVRQEVSRQSGEMQNNGVIVPSKSPWASPVVLVKKRDGSHRFCVDYRSLNAVTTPDSFPLPRIDDLLDKLGKSRYFSTLDLALGFWQIRMHPSSQDKTAFVVPQGLYEFRVMPFGLTNAPGVFQRLMQRVLSDLNPPCGTEFVSVYLDDILIFSRSLEDHLRHLQVVIEKLVAVGLKLKPAKCHFARTELEYLGHTITREGLKTNTRLVEAVRDFPVPKAVHDVRRFLGMASYYRRFIYNFARIAAPLHYLTKKDSQWLWTPRCESAFKDLKERLVTAPVLSYPSFNQEYILETDASIQGLGAVLSQLQSDDKPHPVAYASRALSPSERNYGITELETLAVVWGISHFHHLLYGNSVTVYTDHTSVRAVLESPNPTAKHARWWTRVYGQGLKDVKIRYQAGRENKSADALSRSPHSPPPTVGTVEGELQVATINSTDTEIGKTVDEDPQAMTKLPCLEAKEKEEPESTVTDPHGVVTEKISVPHMNLDPPGPTSLTCRNICDTPTSEIGSAPVTGEIRPDRQRDDSNTCVTRQIQTHAADNTDVTLLRDEQLKDPVVKDIREFLQSGKLPEDQKRARKIVLMSPQFVLVAEVVYYVHPKTRNKHVVVPSHLREKILRETHAGKYSGHFSGRHLYDTLSSKWWWEGMYSDAERFASSCPECIVATGTGRKIKPPLHPIPVQRPFQILGIDDLPVTERGNRHVVVIQDLFTKWPLVFPVPDQKALRIAKLIAEEVVPLFGVPESLLSDRGTNLLSHLVKDLCSMLGIEKLNTTSYHPQCDGAVERFNRTLKTMLRKHAAKFGNQWDTYLFGVLWAYRNTPHSSTGEKPSFLLFGVDCRSPTEAAYMPLSDVFPTQLDDYREQLMAALSTARESAARSIQRAQHRYKEQYDRGTKSPNVRVGEWVFVRFPQGSSPDRGMVPTAS